MSMFALSTITAASIIALCFCTGCNSNGSNRVSMTAVSTGFICPLTGEELPCEDCCPLNQEQAQQHASKQGASASAEGYKCPLTGELLPCPKCCPLNN